MGRNALLKFLYLRRSRQEVRSMGNCYALERSERGGRRRAQTQRLNCGFASFPTPTDTPRHTREAFPSIPNVPTTILTNMIQKLQQKYRSIFLSVE
jgi:hypothetical protein